MSDDFNKGYFGGGNPQNREQRQGVDERIRREREQAQRILDDQRRIQKANQTLMKGPTVTHVGPSRDAPPFVQPRDDVQRAPITPLKGMVFSAALWVMVATALWLYFVQHQPLGIQFGAKLVVGYLAGGALGVGLWALAWVFHVAMAVVAVLFKIAVWGVLLWAGFHFLAGR